MVSHVTTSPRLVDLDAASYQLILTCQDVSPATVVSNAECQDVGMLDEEQDIRDAVALTIFNQRSLKR
jgi:hypothetical protein